MLKKNPNDYISVPDIQIESVKDLLNEIFVSKVKWDYTYNDKCLTLARLVTFMEMKSKPEDFEVIEEIGHGALAEKALVPVIPSEEEFPYAIRVVSEILSSNGSTSQASICGSTLALMDAGVPIKKPVAGISTGLVTNPNNSSEYVMLTDIQGLEDFFGDMDFKVGGTEKGITAIQVDIKVDGLSYKIIEEAFARTRKARQYILDEIMLKQIPEPRKEISKYAPKIVNMKINPEKIKDVIGRGGEEIKSNTDIIFISNCEHLVFESFEYAPFRFVRKSCLMKFQQAM